VPLFFVLILTILIMIEFLEEELIITIPSGCPEETKERLMMSLLSAIRWYAEAGNKHIKDSDSLYELTTLMESLQFEKQTVSVAI
jgi:hypothetical protein